MKMVLENEKRAELLAVAGLLPDPNVVANFGRAFVMALPRSKDNEYATEIWGRIKGIEILEFEEEGDSFELHVHVDQRHVMKDDLLCLVCSFGVDDEPKAHWAAHLRLSDKTDEDSGWTLYDVDGEFRLL